MYYTIYKITNNTNNKIYIGLHKTNSLNDNYFGSGSEITTAIKKYGKENFTKEILHIFNNAEEMELKEAELVTEDFCKSKNTYNKMPGGKYGGLDRNGLTFKNRKHSEETKKSISKSCQGRTHSEEAKEKLRKNNFARRDPESQRKHASKAGSYKKTEEHKQKLREASLKNKNSLGLKREKIKCPHCNKEGAKNTMLRWHFDNCKNRGIAKR